MIPDASKPENDFTKSTSKEDIELKIKGVSVTGDSSDVSEDSVPGTSEPDANIEDGVEDHPKREKKQVTISSMFNNMKGKKRKLLESENQISKKQNCNSPQVITKEVKSIDNHQPLKCKECRQFLDDPELKLFPGDPDCAVEEEIMLTDPKLSIYSDGGFYDDVSERLQHKITNFSVYDCNTHLCAFDAGLIERNVILLFSGAVKPIYDENPSIEGGILTKNMGPINEWWISGFDGGENAIVGFSTAYADYVLMTPSEFYMPFMDAVKEKIHLSKTVIEFLGSNPEASYEDLVNKLETTVPSQGLAKPTEDTLLHHAQFIVDQIDSLDSAADENDTHLLISPSIRALIKLAGVILGKRRTTKKGTAKRPTTSKVKKISFSLATTTPLVRSIFESFFTDQLEKDPSKFTSSRQKRCGVCEVCQLADCGQCSSCRNMVKFGGSGKAKQACARRRCPNMAVQEADEDDILEDENGDYMDQMVLTSTSADKKYRAKKQKIKLTWQGPSIETESKEFYRSIYINDELVSIGDFVLVTPEDPSTPMYVARIVYMWENSLKEKMFHAMWFCRGTDTILGETSSPAEVFGTYDCEDSQLNCVNRKCKVIFKASEPNWFELGGTETSLNENMGEEMFFYQKWYFADSARFEDPPSFHNDLNKKDGSFCMSCKNKEEIHQVNVPKLGDVVISEDGLICYKSFRFLSHTFAQGDCVYLDPGVYSFPEKKRKEDHVPKKLDEETYPEAYRKNDYVKGSNQDVPQPFIIGCINKIFKKSSNDKTLKISVNIFFRPENSHRNRSFNCQMDLNLLYWSDVVKTLEFCDIKGKCYVVYSENLNMSTDDYTAQGPNRFYFSEAYNWSTEEFEVPSRNAMKMGDISKGKGKGKMSVKNIKQTEEKKDEELYPHNTPKLATLDIFAGCGGLSEGFHQAGISDSKWAIEKEEPAAQAFKLNFATCTVFSEDCNLLLRLVMDQKETHYKGLKLPQKGEVELICGGPPCQGFSGMNRFNSNQYSLFKNSLIVSFLSYCDYYRPRFIVLENVRNFVSFKRSMVLKLTLRCLLHMGYQCTFGVLQAGNYGVPQTRRRTIILAAAPGEKLPLYPEPAHVFSIRSCQRAVVVDKKKYTSNIKWNTHAPYRTTTVRDAMSDLPEIRNGAKVQEIAYAEEPLSSFQKKMRGQEHGKLLQDHICKEMNSLVEARMKRIPIHPGADWRDLPNIQVPLSNGTKSKMLIYTHDDKKNGRGAKNALRGVCSCAEKKPCDPLDRQFNTLIPWCLPHTGNRHNHWAGLYGRLEWDGFFSTTITNPEPMGKQGRVLHPNQDRVVSVRECARSQGFPDSYRFFGNILDRHRQVGNAVPPPLAAAIGLEIKKCLIKGATNEDIPSKKKKSLVIHDFSQQGSSK